MNISKEAIEAAARGIADMSTCKEDDVQRLADTRWAAFEPDAHAALEAAAPLLMAQAWDEGADAAYSNAQGALNGLEPTNPYRKEQS